MRKIFIAIMLLAGLLLCAEEPLEVMKKVDNELQQIALRSQKAKSTQDVLTLMKDLTKQMSTYAYATMDLQKQIRETNTLPDSLDTMMMHFASNMQRSMAATEQAVRQFENNEKVKLALDEYRLEMKRLSQMMMDTTEENDSQE